MQYDHPERIRAIHQLAHEQMLQAKLRMEQTQNVNRPQYTQRHATKLPETMARCDEDGTPYKLSRTRGAVYYQVLMDLG